MYTCTPAYHHRSSAWNCWMLKVGEEKLRVANSLGKEEKISVNISMRIGKVGKGWKRICQIRVGKYYRILFIYVARVWRMHTRPGRFAETALGGEIRASFFNEAAEKLYNLMEALRGWNFRDVY